MLGSEEREGWQFWGLKAGGRTPGFLLLFYFTSFMHLFSGGSVSLFFEGKGYIRWHLLTLPALALCPLHLIILLLIYSNVFNVNDKQCLLVVCIICELLFYVLCLFSFDDVNDFLIINNFYKLFLDKRIIQICCK